jgi:hypothetical protein
MSNNLRVAIYNRQLMEKTSAVLLPGLATRLAINKKLGIGASSLGAIEASNALLRAQNYRDSLIRGALAASDTQGAREALDTSLQDIVLDKKLSQLINDSFVMSPMESSKYLLGLK